MKFFLLNNRLNLIALHAFIGAVVAFVPISKLLSTLLIVIGVLLIIKARSSEKAAIYAAGYLVGAEVFFRMTQGFIFYETGKYGVFLFLLLGSIYGRNTNKPNALFIVYILLLLLGVVFTSVPEGESIRNSIVFNLSGPVILGFCAFHFFGRRISKRTLFNAMFFMLMPIISMTSFLYFRTPSIEEIVFGTVANFGTSGGFGPNQVATVLGLGIFIIAAFLITKRKLTGYTILDGMLLIYLIYRGLLTFSRGGIIAAAICTAFFLIFYVLSQQQSIRLTLKILGVSFFVLAGVWLYTSNITGGMLDNRYAGKNSLGVAKKDITSGRLDILKEQLNSFYESPIFGIGVGNGKYRRLYGIKRVTAASHNEIGRLIEEHGLVGLASLLLLIGIPGIMFFKSNNYQKAFLLAFFLFWFLTIGHSAMRIAFPSFIYGLCLIDIYDDE